MGLHELQLRELCWATLGQGVQAPRVEGGMCRSRGRDELSNHAETGQAGVLLEMRPCETPDPERIKESWPLLGLSFVPSVLGAEGPAGRCLTRSVRGGVCSRKPVIAGLGPRQAE